MDEARRKIHVSGYPTYTQPQDLTRIFANYGTVKVEKINNKFAVLTFTDEDEAKEAIEDTNKVNIYGEFLTVKPFTGKTEPSTPKREFARTKQKGEIIEPQLIDLSGDFHQQLDNVLSAVRLTQEEVSTLSGLYVDLEWVLQQHWPGCVAMPFGSITTGLGIKTSDADCFISMPQAYRTPNANFVNKAKKLLQQYPRVFAEILSIPRANTPIVKFFHVPTEMNCDVTFKTPLGVQNSKLIAFLLHADPRLVPLAVALKYWAKVHGFSGTGRLSNYALTMLIVFYLQQACILPSVRWLQADEADAVLVDHWNTGFMHDHEQLLHSTDTSSIAELLGGFFQYYSTFDFDEMMVCPYLGHPVKKDLFRNLDLVPKEFERYIRNVAEQSILPLRYSTAICVQDPIELSHNVASSISSRQASDIKAFVKFAAVAYDKEKLRNCAGFLKTILLQKPKLARRGTGVPDFRVVIYPHILQCIMNSDWKSVVRDTMMSLFEEICKIKLSKVDEIPAADMKKVKEKYNGTVTKAIWKRKQFTKLYSLMHFDFIKKQTRITEEIMNVDQQTFKMQFQLILTFSTDESRNAAAVIKLIDGDVVLFKDFGKFFITNLQTWYLTLLRKFFQPRDKFGSPMQSAKPIDNRQQRNDDNLDDRKVNTSELEGSETDSENVAVTCKRTHSKHPNKTNDTNHANHTNNIKHTANIKHTNDNKCTDDTDDTNDDVDNDANDTEYINADSTW